MQPQLLALSNLELLIAMASPFIAMASNLLAIPKSEFCKLRNSQVEKGDDELAKEALSRRQSSVQKAR